MGSLYPLIPKAQSTSGVVVNLNQDEPDNGYHGLC